MLGDFASSGIWNGLESYIRVPGKNLGEDKSKKSGYTAIALPKALSGA
jgi:hypothetical protein